MSQGDEVEDGADECADPPLLQPSSSPPTECSVEEVLEAADEDFLMETDYSQEEFSADSTGSDEELAEDSSTSRYQHCNVSYARQISLSLIQLVRLERLLRKLFLVR